jgi:hypothetical protein
MKRYLALAAVAAGAAAAAFFQAQAVRTASDFIPRSALLTLEARDFAALLRDWDGSAEKKAWLASANFDTFSKSNLYLKLETARGEFAAAAGVPVSAPLMESVAGGDTAIAIYDIGRLQFLYITRLASARALQTALWQGRETFSPRTSAGQTFYVRVDQASKRVAAFAAFNDWLILATREDLIAGALELIAGQGSTAPVKTERWYQQASAAAKSRGDLRLVMDLDRLTRTPHFRTYWIQNNTSDLRAFTAGVCDAHRSAA